MPSVLTSALFGIEGTFRENDGAADLTTLTGWHSVRPTSDGLSSNRGLITRNGKMGQREQAGPGVPGPYEGTGTLGVEAHPEEAIALLYAAFGDIATDDTDAIDGVYVHTLTPGATQRSIHLIENYGPVEDDPSNPLILEYPGTVINSLSIVGNLGEALRFDYDLTAGSEGTRRHGIPSHSWSSLEPFVGVNGSIQYDPGTGLTVFEGCDNFNLSIGLGTMTRGQFGSQKLAGATVGGVSVSLSTDLYFVSDQELQRYLGDTSVDLTTNYLDLQSSLEGLEDFVITAQTDAEIATGTYYQLKLIIPQIDWHIRGQIARGEDWLRLPLEGTAFYDPTDEYSIAAEVTNGMEGVAVSSPLA